ncbi:MAG: maltose alpha-D-glucosyltransferase [Acidobacteriaceae bacterium]|nr:maltose alpha-D-glucosyltransferase [Acidobacteriaceae bacterium]MBV8569525.1 maltose alpha-D-glucosyltransferase [Acidobacteriaceae bacterium]
MHNSHPNSALISDPLWYKDAIIYEAHVRAFYDSNADGMGDFRGLADKLDYLEDLGVTAIWLLPFFPSPWKDDGYDIADFRSVHPAYGTMRDFQLFLKEAHRRGLRVITELVINHTSDQHVWFQRSRRAEPGSRWRDFYVWSDNPDRYAGTRIIFKDFEPSNWSWDPVAKAYYWHRFYSHQPDLNFDNPLVRRAVIHTLDFWAAMGVDGFRLDAIPYLYEREGTSCENLPETHAFLKELRRHMDSSHPHRMLLAEANMWPEDAVAYFGNGDECHMEFHFPLMPRLFMALRLEDRLPIVEILKRTPPIPETCQWAMFLRNHDELTLEMVTDEERDYMYRVYAADQRARINLGIRRRLAPLLGNDRSRIEVMNALLFSLPGTPVIYYGDEIGMGDNVYLGDRNGVRTPMQWSPDRNAGFSSANPQKLYLPVNIDPAYHYEAVNVESQEDNANSLLNWTKRLIALRKQYKAFGRGTIEFLQPTNQRVLAYLRRYQEETVLVVANLSRFAQAVQLDLHRYLGWTPVEMFGRTDFPNVAEGFYPLTLGPSSFFWFSLEQRSVAVTTAHPVVEAQQQAAPMLSLPSLAGAWDPEIRSSIAAVLPRFLYTRRWFRSRDRRLRSVEISEVIPVSANRHFIVFTRTEYMSGDPETFVIPISIATGNSAQQVREQEPDALIAEVRDLQGAKAVMYSGTRSDEFCSLLLEAFARRRRFNGEQGQLVAQRNREFRHLWGGTHPNLEPSRLKSAEFNTSIRFGDQFVMKILRNIEPGPNPGVEIGQLLTEKLPAPFAHAAPFAGYLEYQANTGASTVISVLHGFVQNEGDGWHLVRDAVSEFLARTQESGRTETELLSSAPINIYSLEFALAPPPAMVVEQIGPVLALAETMGQRVAELHAVFASTVDDAAFAPEPFNDFYRQGLYHGFIGTTERRLEFLRQRYGDLAPDIRPMAARVLQEQDAIITKFRALFERRIRSERTRFVGRLHLGHMLMTQNDVVMFDLEGDPMLPLSERRIKRCPLRDVASMLVSFGYAANAAVRQIASGEPDEALARHEMRIPARFWYSHMSAAFIRGYWKTSANARYMPPSQEEQQVLLETYLLERALLDIRSDMYDKPEFSGMPLRLILHLLDAEAERKMGE